MAGGPCEFLVVPTAGGELGVMADHAALVAGVVPGELRVTTDGAVRTRSASAAGVVDVRDNTVRLLVTSTAEKPLAPPDAISDLSSNTCSTTQIRLPTSLPANRVDAREGLVENFLRRARKS